MNRRSWFKDLGLKAAGLTAFCAVAPAVQAEAAPVRRECCNGACGGQGIGEVMPTLPEGEVWVLSSEVAEARAEGYQLGYDVATSRAESRAALGLPIGEAPLTFEAMAADCAGRGCRLVEWEKTLSSPVQLPHDEAWRIIPTHISQDGVTTGLDLGGDLKRSPLTPTGLARVDAWRRSLHEQLLSGTAGYGPAIRLTRLT